MRMLVQDGFFFGIGFMGAVLAAVIFVLIVSLVTAFVSYLTSKKDKTRRREDDDERYDGRG